MARARSVLLIISVLVLVGAACGDSSSTTTTVGTTATPTTAPPSTSSTTAAPTTTTPATTTPLTGEPLAAKDAEVLLASLSGGATVESGRMEGFMEIVGAEDAPEGSLFAMTFSGAFDNDNQAFAFLMDLSGLAGVLGDEADGGLAELFTELEIRQLGETAYLRFPFFTAFLGVETEWISLPADDSGSATGGILAATPANPTDFLSAFDSVGGEVTEVGNETLRGVDTTRYLVLFDMEELLAAADPEELARLEEIGPLPIDTLPLDIWLAADGTLHRFEMTFDAEALGAVEEEGFEQLRMRFDIFDHGVPVGIEAPPADDVTDAEDLGGAFG